MIGCQIGAWYYVIYALFCTLQGADYVIALTHMRWPNDIRLAENVEDIDLILGGHDHDYEIKQVRNILSVRDRTHLHRLHCSLVYF